jgi:hypothetical protein
VASRGRPTRYARLAREARARPRSLGGASDGIMKRSNALKRPILLESGLILLLALVCFRAPRAAEFSYTPPNLVESRASATATGHRAESGPEKGQQDRTLSSIALLTSSRPKHSEDLPLKSPPVDLAQPKFWRETSRRNGRIYNPAFARRK